MSGIADPTGMYDKARAAGLSGGAEVLQVAVEMERIGKDFYEALAGGCDDRQVASLCLRLAKDEAAHAMTFRRMLANAPGAAGRPRLSEDKLLAAHELAKSQVIPDSAKVHKVGMGGHIKDAVAMAIGMEKDAIQFYGRMRAFVPGADAALVAIIDQEKGHLAALTALRV